MNLEGICKDLRYLVLNKKRMVYKGIWKIYLKEINNLDKVQFHYDRIYEITC